MYMTVLASQQELIYISSGCSLEDLLGGMDRVGQGNPYSQLD